jgi:hypothetical protein
MASDNNTKKWLYDTLRKGGVDMGSYSDYDKAIGNEDTKKWAYNTAKDMGIDMGSYDDFDRAITDKAPSTPASAQPATQGATPTPVFPDIPPSEADVTTPDETSTPLGDKAPSVQAPVNDTYRVQDDGTLPTDEDFKKLPQQQELNDIAQAGEQQQNKPQGFTPNMQGNDTPAFNLKTVTGKKSIPELMGEAANNQQAQFDADFALYKQNPSLFEPVTGDKQPRKGDIYYSKSYKDKRVEPTSAYTVDSMTGAQIPVDGGKANREQKADDEALENFLNNTKIGQQYVKEDNDYNAAAEKDLNNRIDKLEKDINEASKHTHIERKWVPNGTIAGGEYVDYQTPDNEADYRAALQQLQELKYQQAALKDAKEKGSLGQFFGELGRRSPDAALDTASFGVWNLLKDKNIYDNQTGKLTKEATDVLNMYNSLHQNERTVAQDIANGGLQSASFMAQYALTGGASEAFVKGLGTQITKKLGGSTLAAGIGDMVEHTGDSIARTLLSPGTLSQAVQDNVNNPGSFLDSYGRAFTGQFIENFTEGLGERMGTLGIANKLSPKFQKFYKSFQHISGVQGAIPEIVEEEIGNVLHAAAGDGQGNWSDLIDPHQQLTTIGTVLFMQAPGQTIYAGGYAAGKFNNYRQRKSINKAYDANTQNMSAVFGAGGDETAAQGYIQQVQDAVNAGKLREMLIGVANSDQFTDDEKDAIAKYALAYQAKSGLDKALQQKPAPIRGGDAAAEQGASLPPAGQYAAEQQRRGSEDALNKADPDIASTIDKMVADGVPGEQELDNLFNSLDETQRPLAEQYYQDAIRVQGAVDEAYQQASDNADSFDDSLKPAIVTNPDGSQTVTTATYKEQPVYIVGSYSPEDTSVVVMHSDGTREMVNPKYLENVVTSDAQSVMQANRQQVLSQAQAQTDMQVNHNPKTQMPVQGMQVWNGDTPYIISQVGDDGTVQAFPAVLDAKTGQMSPKNGSTPIQMSTDEALGLQDTYYDRLSSQQQAAEQQVPQSPESDKTSQNKGKNETTPIGEIEQSVSNQPEKGSEQSETQEAPTQSPVVYKKDAKGNDTDEVDYEKMKPEDTINYLNEASGNPQVSLRSVRKTSSNAEAALGKAQKAVDKIEADGVDVTNRKEVAAYRKAKESVTTAQKTADYWKNVEAQMNAANITTESPAPNQSVSDNDLSFDEPKTARELIAQELYNGQLPLLYDDYKKETGFGDDEARSMVGLFRSKANGGMTIAGAADSLVGNTDFDYLLPHTDNGDVDTMAVRGIIIDVLQSARTRGDLVNVANESRNSMLKQEQELYESQEREAFEANYHMTPEEYAEYESAQLPLIIEQYQGFDEQPFYDTFADEFLNQKDNGTKRENGGTVASNEVLQREESAQPAGDTGRGQQGEEVSTGVQGGDENAGVSQSTPGKKLNGQETDELIASMENGAVEAPILALTPENWVEQFGKDGKVSTPLGEVKMGENQLEKMFFNNRSAQFGMVKPTLTNPDIIVEVPSEAIDGRSERGSSYLFIKDFIVDGKKIRIFTSVSVKKEGLEVVVSNHIITKNQLRSNILKGKLIWNSREQRNSESLDKNQGLNQSPAESPNGNNGGSHPQINSPSENKDTDSPDNNKKEGDNSSPDRSVAISTLRDKINELSNREDIRSRLFQISDELIPLAKKLGVFIDEDELWKNARANGGTSVSPDSTAFADMENNKVYIDARDATDVLSIKALLNHIDELNELFPDSRIDFIGLTGGKGRFIAPVLSRDLVIEDGVPATENDKDTYMADKGFNKDGKSYVKGDMVVSIDSNNAIKGKDGKLYVIDATIKHDQTHDSPQPMIGENAFDYAKRVVDAINISKDGKTYDSFADQDRGAFDTPQVMETENKSTEALEEAPSYPLRQRYNELVESARNEWGNKADYAVDYNEEGDLYMDAEKALTGLIGDKEYDKWYSEHVDKAEGVVPLRTILDEIDKQSSTQKSTSISQKPTEKIEDFGEKIGGARKDLAQDYLSRIDKVSEGEMESLPLSKSFPRPDFVELVKAGILTENVAMRLSFLYDNIPAKPRRAYAIKSWAKKVRATKDVVGRAIKGEDVEADIAPAILLAGQRYDDYAALREALGFPKNEANTKGYSIEKAGDAYWVVKGRRILKRTVGENRIKEAIDFVKSEINKEGGKTKSPIEFAVYGYRDGNAYRGYFVAKKGKADIPLTDTFKTANEAREYLYKNRAELEEKWKSLTVKYDERNESNRERVGADWRNGKDVTPEEFGETFGFRGVEFGNWVNQSERQKALNEAYDALMDLSSATGISPRALSLNGELGMAFGARGQGRANAHYERDKVVINLTKTRGAGSLVHEWWHAVDNYFSRKRGDSLSSVTENMPRAKEDDAVRKEMLDAFRNIVRVINSSGMHARSRAIDATRTSPYWSTNVEMTARAFENYIITKLAENENHNDYLANLSSLDEWIAKGYNMNFYPYPNTSEETEINEAYQQFFDTVQESVDETTGKRALFQTEQDSQKFRRESSERVSRLVDRLMETGLAKSVVIDKEAMRAALDNISGRKMSTPAGEVYGFVTADGTIYLDPDKMNFNTPIHEFGHLWVSLMKDVNPELLAAGSELVRNSPYWDMVNKNPAYASMSEAEKLDEALAMAIGDKGELMTRNGDVMAYSGIRKWLNDFWNWIKSKIGMSSKLNVEDMKLNDFTENVVRQLTAGRRIDRSKSNLDISTEEKKIIEKAQKEDTYMKAPNGNPSKLDERQWAQVRTKAFKNWFGDWENDPDEASKVIDENGEPRVVYHGTNRIFTEYDIDKTGSHTDSGMYGRGFYFSPDIREAERYAQVGMESGVVMPVYLDIKSPMRITNNFVNIELTDEEEESLQSNRIYGTKVTEKMRNDGFDGVFGYHKLGDMEFVVFDANQIKSATSNTGEFSSDSNDIRYSFGDMPKSPIFVNSKNEFNEEVEELVGSNEEGQRVRGAITEASSDERRGDSPAEENRQGTWDKEQFLGKLEVASRQNGSWIDDIHPLVEQTLSKGQESEVYLSKDGKNVVKVNNLSLLDDEHGFDSFIDRLSAHNELFPDAPYKIVGFTENSLGEFSVVLEQPYVRDAHPAEQSIIDSFLRENGFDYGRLSDGEKGWSNGEYELWDAEPKNVLEDKQGNLHFIDTVVNHTSSNDTSDSVRYAYVRNDSGINMSQRAQEALDEGKTDIGTHLALGAFIENEGLGTFDGEWHHVGKSYNRHYFVTLNDGVTLAKARKLFKESRQKESNERFNKIMDENPGSFPVDEADMNKYPYPSYRTVAYNDGKFFVVPNNDVRERRFDPNENMFEVAQRAIETNQVQDAVDSFTSKYKSLSVVVVNKGMTREEVEKAFGDGASQSDIDIAMDELSNPRGLSAAFMPKSNKIIIFAGAQKSLEGIENTLFHENVHSSLRKLFGNNYEKVVGSFYEKAKGIFPKQVETLSKLYPKEQVPEELFAYYMDHCMSNGNFEDLKNIMGDDYSKVEKILNNIGYNEQEEIESRKDKGISRKFHKGLFDDAGETQGGSGVQGGSQTGRRSGEKPQTIQEGLNSPRFKKEALDEDMFDDNKDNELSIVEKQVGSARDQYERTLRTGAYKFQEAWQDSMLGLKVLQDEVAKATGGKVLDYENAYMAENALSSTNLAEMEAYRELAFKPILEAVKVLEKAGVKYGDITDYLMIKHGLERNVEMAVRKAAEADDETRRQVLDDWHEFKKGLFDDRWSFSENYQDLVDEALKYGADLSVDYAGLTGVMTNDEGLPSEMTMEDLTQAALSEVEDFEKANDTHNLWDAINKANDAVLDKQLESGILSKDTYNLIKDMYQYYVPLRGWNATTADEVYDYLTSETSPVNTPNKTAKGRKSKADDPIATIANMAETGIIQGNRNLMKQRFLNLVENHRTDLVSVKDLWVRRDDVTGMWTAIMPDIPDNATPKEVEDIMQDFDTKMEKLQEENKDKYKRAKDMADIPYKILPRNLSEHQVMVKRAGKPYMLTINGNPRAAQAVNGLTNPDADRNPFIQGVQAANRFMSANFTSRNPAFVLANLSRDFFYGNTAVWVKESPDYAWRYNKNWQKSMTEMGGLLRRYKANKLDISNPIDRLFSEFIANGGETGYTFINSVEDYKGKISKELKKANQTIPIRKAFGIVADGMDTFSRWAEDTSRFAAYRTSREMGRSISKSVADAKEISVNFNKKGAGSKTAGRFEKGNRLNALQGWLAQMARGMYIFWNPAVQGMANMGKMAKNNKGKVATAAALYFALGAVAPILNAALASALGGSGDEDDYYNLPEYVRRSNICLYVGGRWLTIPLPIELRALYGMGELATSAYTGKEQYTKAGLGKAMAGQISQILPADIIGEGGGSLYPSYAKPIIEAYVNKDWTGIPIYKDNGFNKNMPAWTKAYKSTSPELIKATEWLNQITGGDKYTKGGVNFNPGIIEHLFSGYLGGIASFTDRVKKTAMMPFDENLQEWRNIPIANRFVRGADLRVKDKRINNNYFDNVDKYNAWKQSVDGYQREMDNAKTDFDYAYWRDKYNKATAGEEGAKYEDFGDLLLDIKAQGDDFKESGDEQDERDLYNLKQQANEIMQGSSNVK